MFWNRFATGIVAATCLLTTELGASVLIDDYDPEKNLRFQNNPDFVLNSYDLSGVGITASSARFGTLLSDNVFVSAAHYHPELGGTMQFSPGNDPVAPLVERTVVQGYAIPDTDLWLGVLNAPVPSSITHYGYTTIPIATAAEFYDTYVEMSPNGWIIGDKIAMVLLERDGSSANIFDQVVGINRLDYWKNPEVVGAFLHHDFPQFEEEPYVQFESVVQSGDSGGPCFLIENGELVLVGVNRSLGQLYPKPFGGSGAVVYESISLFNYIGSESAEVADVIAMAAVPEVNSLIGFLLVFCGLLGTTRRRR